MNQDRPDSVSNPSDETGDSMESDTQIPPKTSASEEDASPHNLVVVSEILPDALFILPFQDRPIFPGLVMPIFFNKVMHRLLLSELEKSERKFFGAVLIRHFNEKHWEKSDLHRVGTVFKALRLNKADDNNVQVVAQSLRRFEYVRTLRQDGYIQWQVRYYYEPETIMDDELKGYTRAIITSARDLLRKDNFYQEQLRMLYGQIRFENPGLMMDMIASSLPIEAEKLQQLLEAFPLIERAKKLLLFLKEENQLLELQEKIKKQIEEKISEQQKEFFLREQLKAIKKELGIEKDDKSAEIEKFEQRLQSLKLSEEAREIIENELDKLRTMERQSPEYNVSRNYLDVMTSLPWGKYTEDRKDIHEADRILNNDHYGLDDVKERILEFISTIIRKGRVSGSNILLVGPPGVGKTSIGKSIASALDRKFFRFSVGGMRDEAEIKGHRRTYIGALPGKIIESIKRAGSSNPVIMIDELDKIGKGFHGDPASALLEVLDPEQNHMFLDHYLDAHFDLSNVLFITTANQLDTIPSPLLDRMEIIRLSGYILEEKREIAKRYLIPKQISEHGLNTDEIVIEDPAIDRMIDHYAREAGVRNLENQIKKIMRKTTLKLAKGNEERAVVTPENIEDYLGKPVFHRDELFNRKSVGVVVGLAYTALGGTTLYIEARPLRTQKAGFRQTGQLGDVMKESAEIAYTYIRSHLQKIDACRRFFDKHLIHLHVPAGATPKDGPSAGITMALALYSLATGRQVRQDIAMTGELTLTGKVLPIGGVREKTIAARRVGIRQLIFPAENEKDFGELPDYIRDGITVIYADYFIDVLRTVFPKRDRIGGDGKNETLETISKQ